MTEAEFKARLAEDCRHVYGDEAADNFSRMIDGIRFSGPGIDAPTLERLALGTATP